MQNSSKPTSIRRVLLEPQPIDRLGIITLLSSLYFFQVWGLIEGSSFLHPFFHYAMMGFSLIGIILPRIWQALSINVLIFVFYFLLHSPISSNNLTTAFFFSLVIIAVYLTSMFRKTQESETREDIFTAIAGPGRWILAGLYFYGIYHKINTDFLDPVVSCAVVLYRTLAGHVSLQDFLPGHYVAIYITFIIEAIAMVALFIPRLKRFGMMIGLPFHIIIGFTGYAYYKDFSTIVLVLYALFLPKAAVEYGVSRIIEYVGDKGRTLWIGRFVLIGFVATYIATSGVIGDLSKAATTHLGFAWFFAFYCFVYYAFVMLSMNKPQSTHTRFSLNWLYIIPALFFLNGMSPYLGLKTESSIAMFSNLHTEGGQTNHLIHGRLLGTFTYQENPIIVVGSNNPNFERGYVRPGGAIIRYELDKLLSHNPNLTVTVASGDNHVETDENWVNTFDETNWIMKKFLVFKPVDFARPKVCTH